MRTVDTAALKKSFAEGARTLDLRLSDAQLDKAIAYLTLLEKWNAVYNLTAVRDPAQMVKQHLLDSLAVVTAFGGRRNVLDVGSGGGLPGVMLAIWASEADPDMRISMIDIVHKKTAFLTQAKVELGLTNVTIHTGRVEQLQVKEKFDAITSRAFAEIADFVTWSAHLLADGGQFIAMKGIDPVAEIARLPAPWVSRETRKIIVPGLNAERHLIFMERSAGAA
ncbi:MAG: 16S rRNA (guanine(527)-N(7))-methyltransferase RsmG [Herminiimonas sp.]|nr:16S rRNA (guanine(527)-N(7))-methyltransferase RsmG [Herminiimonas sp.]